MDAKININGRHAIADFYGCPFERLDNLEAMEQEFRNAVAKASMNLASLNSKKFEPQGLTSLALLEESHLSIHTYPEYGFAALDCFTCGNEGDPRKALEYLAEVLRPKRITWKELERGDDIRPEDFEEAVGSESDFSAAAPYARVPDLP